MTQTGTSDRERLGIGLAAVGRPAYITAGRVTDLGAERDVATFRDRTFAVLDTAYDAGIRYIDAARSYGRAEEFLAAWLAAHPEIDDVVVGSKWGYRYVGDWRTDAGTHEVKDHSLAAFTAQWAQTSALLGERVGIYHVPRPPTARCPRPSPRSSPASPRTRRPTGRPAPPARGPDRVRHESARCRQ